MQCPFNVAYGSLDDEEQPEGDHDDGDRVSCPFTGTLREIERHRHTEHGEPKWDIVFDLPPGEPEAEP